jgi:hypothetical protein
LPSDGTVEGVTYIALRAPKKKKPVLSSGNQTRDEGRKLERRKHFILQKWEFMLNETKRRQKSAKAPNIVTLRNWLISMNIPLLL